MEQKKPTNAQLQSKIRNAIVIVPKDKDTVSVYFSDKGVRYTVTDDYAVISTNFHSHVFDKVTASGYSRPYLYTKQFVEMALDNDCTVKTDDGGVRYSYKKLFDVLEGKEDQTEFIIAKMFDMWSFNIFQPLYGIEENAASQFLVYFDYMHNIAKNSIVLDEHKDGMTSTEFSKLYAKAMKEFTKGAADIQIFEAESDDDKVRKMSDSLKEDEQEESSK